MRPDTVHVSATPGPWEMERTGGVFTEQVIRPTGLIDPPVEIKPVSKGGFSQVDDVIDQVRQGAAQGYRSLITVLTKKMAEDLSANTSHEQGTSGSRYMHSDVDTLERIDRLSATCVWALLRRARRNQLCCAKASTYLECGPGRDPRRRQGRFPALGNLADPDHRARGAKRRWPRNPLRRQRHGLHGTRHGRDQASARKAGGVQHPARHHRHQHQEPHQGHPGVTLRKGPRHRARGRRAGWLKALGLGDNFKADAARPGRPHARGVRRTWNSRRPRACATRSSG